MRLNALAAAAAVCLGAVLVDGAQAQNVRVLVVATNQALTHMAGTLASRAQTEIDRMNTATLNSGIGGVTFSLAGVWNLDQNSLGPTPGTIFTIAASKNDGILHYRDQYNADSVILIDDVSGANCSGDTYQIPAFTPRAAFSAIGWGALYGGGCGDKNTFQHELAHQFGTHHQDSGAANPSSNWTGGGNARGWYFRQIDHISGGIHYCQACFNSIMAYDNSDADGNACGAGQPVLWFSTTASVQIPVSGCSALAVFGDTAHNNAGQIATYAPTLSAFHLKKIALAGTGLMVATMEIPIILN